MSSGGGLGPFLRYLILPSLFCIGLNVGLFVWLFRRDLKQRYNLTSPGREASAPRRTLCASFPESDCLCVLRNGGSQSPRRRNVVRPDMTWTGACAAGVPELAPSVRAQRKVLSHSHRPRDRVPARDRLPRLVQSTS